MAYEFLERLFGTPKEDEQPKSLTCAELKAAIEADKKLQLVDLAEGGYVPQHTFDAQKVELEGVRQQLTTANTTIKGYKDMKPEDLKKAVADWESKYKTDTEALKQQLSAQARSHAEDMLLSGFKFTSKAARNGVAAELRGKNFQLSESGELTGASEWLKELAKQEDYKGAFVTEQLKEPPAETPAPRFAGPTGVPGNAKNNVNTNPFGDMGFSYVNKPKQ